MLRHADARRRKHYGFSLSPIPTGLKELNVPFYDVVPGMADVIDAYEELQCVSLTRTVRRGALRRCTDRFVTRRRLG